MTYISPTKATTIYNRICETQNIKRPTLHHYIQDYCSGVTGTFFLSMVENAKLDTQKGLVTHATKWTEEFIAERKEEWEVIRKKRYRG